MTMTMTMTITMVDQKTENKVEIKVEKFDPERDLAHLYDLQQMSPFLFDYIPNLDKEKTLKVLQDEYLSDSNYNFTLKSKGETIAYVLMTKLRWDSDFFGYNVFKIGRIFHCGDLANLNLGFIEVLKLLKTEFNSKYTFLLIDSRDLEIIPTLESNNFKLIETRATYFRDLRDFSNSERFDVRLATAKDSTFLEEVSAGMINKFDRFHSDPFLNQEKVSELMKIWISKSVKDNFADGVLVNNSPEPSAFCSYKIHSDKVEYLNAKLSQIILTAVDKKTRGWFRKLLSEFSYLSKDLGCDYGVITTQLQNYAVIKGCEKLGYRYANSEFVFRMINE